MHASGRPGVTAAWACIGRLGVHMHASSRPGLTAAWACIGRLGVHMHASGRPGVTAAWACTGRLGVHMHASGRPGVGVFGRWGHVNSVQRSTAVILTLLLPHSPLLLPHSPLLLPHSPLLLPHSPLLLPHSHFSAVAVRQVGTLGLHIVCHATATLSPCRATATLPCYFNLPCC